MWNNRQKKEILYAVLDQVIYLSSGQAPEKTWLVDFKKIIAVCFLLLYLWRKKIPKGSMRVGISIT